MTKQNQNREPATRFDLDSVRREWDFASDAYADAQLNGLDYFRLNFFGPAMIEACGNVNSLKVLDLGCGIGYFSRQMAQKGASKVVGIDISPNQLAHAQKIETEERLGIEYIEGDAATVIESLPETSFDLVTACVSLIDMPDPGRVIRGAYRVLRDRGRLVFTNLHPVADTRSRMWVRDVDGKKLGLQIADYFDESPFTPHMAERPLQISLPNHRQQLHPSDLDAMGNPSRIHSRRFHRTPRHRRSHSPTPWPW